MEGLERLVVHVEEATRLSHRQDLASQRVALILFDSAAELLLHRAVQTPLQMNEIHLSILKRYELEEARRGPLPPEIQVSQADIAAASISRTKVGKVERFFDAKAELLGERELLPTELVRVLRKLHQYRNETYHRDRLRDESIRTAVAIYRNISYRLMQLLPPHMASFGRDAPEVVRKYFKSDSLLNFDAQAEIGKALAEQDRLDGSAVACDLRDHLRSRLDDLDEGLDFIVSVFHDQIDGDEWDRSAAVQFVQLPDDTDVRSLGPSDFRRMTAPVTVEAIAGWADKADRVADMTEGLGAFASFADLEDEFEPFEARVTDLVNAIEREIDLQRDIARGK